ncbi:MAG TPA: PhzF family phenazine biosynthesis protein [Usitatibacteraceae bacterium]
MATYPFRLVNVFAESIFGGNPLCVFEDGRGLDDAAMQALALQFNLSETTFILPSANATAQVRIFTPTFEMAFAGHPTLGSAHIVREIFKAGDQVTLQMKAGIIPVQARQDRWTLTAGAPKYRDCGLSRMLIATMLGIAEKDVLPGARWVNTGSEQLIIPLANAQAVASAKPKADLFSAVASDIGRSMAYVFAPNGEEQGKAKLLSRFFFLQHGAIVEDPGTGSATANLGGWLAGGDHTLPVEFTIDQGAAVGRPCRIGLRVDADRRISVDGRVLEIGRGVITL